jgi:hypothetical protein
MKKVSTLAICLLLIGTAAMAQAASDEIDVRQKAQRVRIIHGRHHGSISRREAHLLRKQQQHIRRAACRVEADGVVKPQKGDY